MSQNIQLEIILKNSFFSVQNHVSYLNIKFSSIYTRLYSKHILLNALDVMHFKKWLIWKAYINNSLGTFVPLLAFQNVFIFYHYLISSIGNTNVLFHSPNSRSSNRVKKIYIYPWLFRTFLHSVCKFFPTTSIIQNIWGFSVNKSAHCHSSKAVPQVNTAREKWEKNTASLCKFFIRAPIKQFFHKYVAVSGRNI